MISKLSLFFANMLVANNIIDSKNINIYAYGIRAMAIKVLFLLFIFIISFNVNELVFSFVFYTSLSVVRAYYGKYHAKNRIRCFFCSSSVFIFCLYANIYIIQYYNIQTLTIIILVTLVLLNAIKYNGFYTKIKKDGIVITKKILILSIGFFAFYFLNFRKISYGIFFGFLSTLYFECIRLFFAGASILKAKYYPPKQSTLKGDGYAKDSSM